MTFQQYLMEMIGLQTQAMLSLTITQIDGIRIIDSVGNVWSVINDAVFLLAGPLKDSEKK